MRYGNPNTKSIRHELRRRYRFQVGHSSIGCSRSTEISEPTLLHRRAETRARDVGRYVKIRIHTDIIRAMWRHRDVCMRFLLSLRKSFCVAVYKSYRLLCTSTENMFLKDLNSNAKQYTHHTETILPRTSVIDMSATLTIVPS